MIRNLPQTAPTKSTTENQKFKTTTAIMMMMMMMMIKAR